MFPVMGKSLQAWNTWIWTVKPIFLGRFCQVLSELMRSICEVPSSCLCTETLLLLSLGFSWATQGQSHTCPEVTLLAF